MQQLLLTYENVQVRLSRETDKTVSLQQRADMANKWNADFLISVHINAGGGNGFETFIFPGVGGVTKRNQDILHAEVMKELDGVRDRGKKRADFHMLRETKMDAILTENLFIDNAGDAAKLKLTSILNKFAQGHVNGVVKAYGLKKRKQLNRHQPQHRNQRLLSRHQPQLPNQDLLSRHPHNRIRVDLFYWINQL